MRLFVCWRRWTVALLVSGLVGMFALPRTASAQEKDALALVPGGAFGFLDFRLAEFSKTDFFSLLPAQAQKEFRNQAFDNPHPGQGLNGMTMLFLEPRDFLPREKEKVPSKSDFKDKDPGPPVKPKVPTLDDLDDKALARYGGPVQIYSYAERVNLEGPGMEGWTKQVYKGKTVYSRGYGSWLAPVGDHLLVMTRSRSALKRFLDGTTGDKGGLAPLLATASKDDAHAILAFSARGPAVDKFRKEFMEMLDESFGFFVFGSLLEPMVHLDSLYLRLSMESRPKLEGSATFLSEKEAARAAENVRDALVILRVLGVGSLRQSVRYAERNDYSHSDEERLFLSVLADELEGALRGAAVEQKKTTVTLAMQAPREVAAVKAAMAQIAKEWAADPKKQELRLRRISRNNLQQIGIALHSFHDVRKVLPPQAICDPKTGKPLLSWRVAILPYIEQGSLYSQFKLDEPWDSQHNIKLLDQVPPVYAPLGKTKEKNETFYQGFVGPGAIFELQKDPLLPWGAKGQKIVAIPDGTSNTFMVVEAGVPVPWSKPEDLPFDPDPKAALPKLGGVFKDGFHVLFGDASVTFISWPVSEEALRTGIDGRDGRPFERRFRR